MSTPAPKPKRQRRRRPRLVYVVTDSTPADTPEGEAAAVAWLSEPPKP